MTKISFNSKVDDCRLHDAYMREFGAEFGEENQGVFKHKFINQSLKSYFNSYSHNNRYHHGIF